MQRYRLILVLAALVSTACTSGESNHSSDESVTRELATSERKYQFVQNGCTTGEIKAVDQAGLCTNLQNETLNKDCALELRRTYFSERCAGDFKSFRTGSVAEDSNIKQIQCDGFVDGKGGYHPVHQTIRWDGTTEQKVILLPFANDVSGDPRGELSVTLVPAEGQDVSRMVIHHWFVDNTKDVLAAGRSEDDVTLTHVDSRASGRNVSVTCQNLRPGQLDRKSVKNYAVSCLGNSKVKRTGEEVIASVFTEWDGKSEVTLDIKAIGPATLPPVHLTIGAVGDRVSSKLEFENLDGHVSNTVVTTGGLYLAANFISALDDREFGVNCMFREDWARSWQK